MTQDAAGILAEQLIASIEAGNLPPWRKTWDADSNMPRNAVTGKAYRGANVWFLLLAGAAGGYSDPRWVTFNQAREAGGSVVKGAKSTPVVFWKPLTREVVAENGAVEDVRAGALLRFYRVFNVEQTEGCRFKALPEPRPEPDRIADAEAIVTGMPNPPRFNERAGAQAAYMPTTDTITMARIADFGTAEEYYATRFHEMAHATGADHRLGRDGVTEAVHFGSERYGREELVAEMTAALLGGECGIAPATIENSAAYLASWLRTLRAEPRMLLTAAAQAQKAADYILDRTPVAAAVAA